TAAFLLALRLARRGGLDAGRQRRDTLLVLLLVFLRRFLDLDRRRLDRARQRRRLTGAIGAQPLEAEARWDQRIVARHHDLDTVARLDLSQGFTLLVQDIERHRGRHIDTHLSRPAADPLFPDRPP